MRPVVGGVLAQFGELGDGVSGDPQVTLDQVIDRGLGGAGGAEPERVGQVGRDDGRVAGSVDA